MHIDEFISLLLLVFVSEASAALSNWKIYTFWKKINSVTKI